MAPETVLLILRILIALVLYAFLALIFFYLWKDLRQEKVRDVSSPQAHLITLSGGKLEPYYKLNEVNLIGRAEDNTTIIPDSTISAYHARLSYRQDQWWLEDLGSRNGTALNDIAVTEPLVVTSSDEIRLGSVHFEFATGPVPTSTSHPTYTGQDASPVSNAE
ncbi:MAG: FHA domain-containing protein [Anaerolineales bacterium]|nr:FHA domain-containing protein [Anaerolineales bacterium]